MEFFNAQTIEIFKTEPSYTGIATLILSWCFYAYILITVSGLIVSYLVGKWGVFKKIGVQPWKSLIPVYNGIILYKKFFKCWVYPIKTILFLTIIPTVYFIFTLDAVYLPYTFLAAIVLIWMSLYFIFRWNVSEAFDCSKLFFVGLIFFPSFFTALLGWNSKTYNHEVIEEEMHL